MLDARPGMNAWSALHHARAIHILGTAGIDALVIKGPSLAWLYPEGRASADADILVAPSTYDSACDALTAAGYEPVHAGVHADEVSDHSTVFTDPVLGDRELDLHTSYPGFGAEPSAVWDKLWRRHLPALVAGVPAASADRATSALIAALHAARNGPVSRRGAEDVRRLVSVLDDTAWTDVMALARDLDAIPALSAGLRLAPEGERLAARLGLARASDPVWDAEVGQGGSLARRLVQLRQASPRRKAEILRHELWPSAAFLRAGWPVARHGVAGLVAAYVQRLAGIVRRLPRAWLAARAAERRSRA